MTLVRRGACVAFLLAVLVPLVGVAPAAALDPTQSDLSVSTTASPAVVAYGGTMTYTTTVSNAGPDVATDVVVRHRMPAWVDPGPPSAGCVNEEEYDPVDGLVISVVCTIPLVPVGSLAPVTRVVPLVSLHDQRGSGTVGIPEVRVSVAHGVPSVAVDPNLSNNESRASTHYAAADLAATQDTGQGPTIKSANAGDPVAVGSDVTLSAPLTNFGPNPAYNVYLTGVLVGMTVTPLPWYCVEPAPATVRCKIGGFGVNSGSALVVPARINTGHVGDASVTWTVSSASLDPNAANDTRSASVTPAEGASGQGTVSTGSTPTPADPIETTVVAPNASTITIAESTISQGTPTGYQFLGSESVVRVSQPSTAANPFVFSFSIDGSLLSASGATPDTVEVFRNGAIVPACVDPSQAIADPDPCWFERVPIGAGGVRIGVYTSNASRWNVGVSTVSGLLSPLDAPVANVRAGSTLKIAFSVGGFQGDDPLGTLPVYSTITCGGADVGAQQPIVLAKDPSYSRAKDIYTYPWKTPAVQGCYKLTVTIPGGFVRTAVIDTRK